jgi:hypothetical protein
VSGSVREERKSLFNDSMSSFSKAKEGAAHVQYGK